MPNFDTGLTYKARRNFDTGLTYKAGRHIGAETLQWYNNRLVLLFIFYFYWCPVRTVSMLQRIMCYQSVSVLGVRSRDLATHVKPDARRDAKRCTWSQQHNPSLLASYMTTIRQTAKYFSYIFKSLEDCYPATSWDCAPSLWLWSSHVIFHHTCIIHLS